MINTRIFYLHFPHAITMKEHPSQLHRALLGRWRTDRSNSISPPNYTDMAYQEKENEKIHTIVLVGELSDEALEKELMLAREATSELYLGKAETEIERDVWTYKKALEKVHKRRECLNDNHMQETAEMKEKHDRIISMYRLREPLAEEKAHNY